MPTIIPSGRRLPYWPLGPQGRVDREFSDCCTSQNALVPLMRIRPKIAAEVLLAAIIEDSPEESYSSARYDDGFGLDFDKDSYPTAYWKSPFLTFLQIAPSTALEALISLVNFCTERWCAEYRRLWSEPPHPTRLLLSDGIERAFFGDPMVFLWSQSNSTHTGQLHSALAALERYFVVAAANGLDVGPNIQLILRTGTSVALLGVLASLGKSRAELFSTALRPLAAHPWLYFWDEERVKALPYSFATQWAGQGETIFNMARDWHHAPYRSRSMRDVIGELVRSNEEFAAFVNDATAAWEAPQDDKGALELRILAAQLDARNYRPGSEGAFEFMYPPDLTRDIRTFENGKAPSRLILQLPDVCHQVLSGKASLSDSAAEALAATFAKIEAESELGEEFKTRARVAAASTLLAKGRDWLNEHPAAHEQAQAILAEALASVPTTAEGLRSSRLEHGGLLQFAAHAIFELWLNADAPEAQEAVLKVVTSGDRAGVGTIFNLAYQRRSELGERCWRLLYLGLLWSALSMLRPGYGQGDDENVRWSRWLGWLRGRRLDVSGAGLNRTQPRRGCNTFGAFGERSLAKAVQAWGEVLRCVARRSSIGWLGLGLPGSCIRLATLGHR